VGGSPQAMNAAAVRCLADNYAREMEWWQAALWALAGGVVVEGLEFAALQRRHRKWPWEVDAEASAGADSTAAGPLGYFLGELLRLGAGGILGAALAGQVTGPLAALAIGAAAPAIAEKLVAYVPLPPTPSEASPAPAAVPQPPAQPSLGNNGSVPTGQEQLNVSGHSVSPEPLPEREGTT
jgi:hypothetical protein